MKLYCATIECESTINKELSDARVEHFFANDDNQMEDRLVEVIKELKKQGIETRQFEFWEVGYVDGLDISQLLQIIRYSPKKNSED